MNTQAPHWNLNNTIASIYEAALEPSLWPSVLKSIRDILQDSQVSLLFMDDNLQPRNTVITHNTIYSEKFNTNKPTFTARKFHDEFLSTPLGKWVFIDSEPSPIPKDITEKEILSATHLTLSPTKSSRLLIPLLLGDSIGAALLINTSDNLNLSPSSMAVIEQLSPHFVRAIHIHNHLSALKHRNDSMLEALQRTNIPVFILNADLQAIFISREAELLLARQPTLKMNAKGHLQAFFAEEQNTLIRLLNEFLAKGFNTDYWLDKGIGLAIRHPDRAQPLRLCFLPIQKPDFNQPQLPFIAIFAYDPEQPRHIAPEYLKQAFNLTPTEIHVAQLLASGFNISEISEVRGTTLESTRWQMKQVLQKTNTHSQAELVRMLVILSNDFNADLQLLQNPPKNPTNL